MAAAVLQHIAVSNSAFWAKLAVGGLLMGTSLPGILGRVRWPPWVLFGAGLEFIVWALLASPWIYVGLGVVGVLAVVGIAMEYHRSEPALDPTPTVNLSFGEPYSYPYVLMEEGIHPEHPDTPTSGSITRSITAAALSATGGSYVDTSGPDERGTGPIYAAFTFVRVINSQSSPGHGVTAKDAHAKLAFFSEDGTRRLIEMEGRWRESAPARELPRNRLAPERKTIAMPPNDQIHELDVTMKYHDDPYCYAYNTENQFTADGRLQSHRLTEQVFHVRVEVLGTNFPPLVGWFELKQQGAGHIPTIARLLDQPPPQAQAPQPPPAPASASMPHRVPMSELEAATRRNQEDVLRADLVLLSDEIAAARRTILAAYNNSVFWKSPITVQVWDAVKNKHLSAKGFHGARSNIAEAYEAIKRAENLRLMHNVDRRAIPDTPLVMHEADRHELREILDRVVAGENSLTQYLDVLDMPQW